MSRSMDTDQLRLGEVGSPERRIVEVELLTGLGDWCSAHSLHVKKAAQGPYQADAAMEGEALRP